MKLLTLALMFIVCLISFSANAQQAARNKAPSKVPADVENALKTVAKLRPLCAKPKDAFETEAAAASRVFAGFNPPILSFRIRPTVIPPEQEGRIPFTRRWGGEQRGGVRYHAEKQELRVYLPARISDHGYRERPPFGITPREQPDYAVLVLAEQGQDLGYYAASNAFGASARVSWNQETFWNLVLLRSEDISRLRINGFTAKSGSPFYTVTVAPDEARALASALAWIVEVRIEPVPGTKCIVEVNEYTSRMPKLDNPWREDRVDINIPVSLMSLQLLDTRNNLVLWETRSTP